MRNLKLTFGLFSLLAILAVSFLITSCEQEAVTVSPTTPEIQIQQGKFAKDIVVNSDDNTEIKLTVSTDDNTLLELIDENSFTIEAIYEVPEGSENENEPPLNTDNFDNIEDTEAKLIISIDDENLPENAIGFSINFNNNEEISSRYNRISGYYQNPTRRRVFTRNTSYMSIRMHYFDDGYPAGYRSLCSGPCPQTSYTFSRNDNGVGCQFEYWSFGYANYTISFY